MPEEQHTKTIIPNLYYEKFNIIGHDRGARIAHRMALDFPDKILKIIPSCYVEIQYTSNLFSILTIL